MAWTPTYAHIHVTHTLSLNLLTFKQQWGWLWDFEPLVAS